MQDEIDELRYVLTKLRTSNNYIKIEDVDADLYKCLQYLDQIEMHVKALEKNYIPF